MSQQGVSDQDLIYDWNSAEKHTTLAPGKEVLFMDETLRDGIQCPSVHDPDIDAKLQTVRLLDAVGVYSVNVGLPGAGPRAVADSTTLVELIRDEKLDILPGAAARTLANDIRPIVDITQKTGVPVEVMTFLGSSPIRMYAESWDEDKLEQLTRNAVKLGVEGGCPVSFVTEDTVRSHPTTLTRQDWRGPRASWRSDGLGHWETYIERDGTYEFTLRFAELPDKGSINLKIGDVAEKARVSKGADDHTFKSVKLKEGYGRVEAWIDIDGTTTGVQYVDVRRVRR